MTLNEIAYETKRAPIPQLEDYEWARVLPGGPKNRYVIHPTTGNVIDMRHLLIIGSTNQLVGDFVEEIQFLGIDKVSGRDPQDYYSNKLGYEFYQKHAVLKPIYFRSYSRSAATTYHFKNGIANELFNFLNAN